MRPEGDPGGVFPDQLLTLEMCASVTRTSYGVIRRATQAGCLPSGRAGRRILVKAEDLLAWVQSGSRETSKPLIAPTLEGKKP